MRFILLACLVVTTYSSISLAADTKSYSFKISKEEDDIFEKCAENFGFNEKNIMEVVEKMRKEKEKLTDTNIKCFTACLYKESKVLKEDGSIDVDAAIKYHHAENVDSVKEVIKECSSAKKENGLCDIAYSFQMCMSRRE